MGIVNLRPAVARNLLTTVGLGLTMGLAACDCGDPESLAIRQPVLEVVDPKTNNPTDTLDFGQVPMGVPLQLPLLAKNTGSDDLFICMQDSTGGRCTEKTHIDPAGAPFETRFENVAADGWQVGVGTDREFLVRFTPKDEGPVEAVLILGHNGKNGPTTSIKLVGNGVAPQIDFSATSLDFGPVTVGRRKALELTLTNQTQFPQPLSIPPLEQLAITFGTEDAQG